ncbi:unnamed protein product [Tenebrio molitor]|nr:unnamed protein product [Tenebrio molitor]
MKVFCNELFHLIDDIDQFAAFQWISSSSLSSTM